MARRATKKIMTIEELKALLRSQLYLGRLVDTGIPIVKSENYAVSSYRSRKDGSSVNG